MLALVGWTAGATAILGTTLPAAWLARRPVPMAAVAPIIVAAAPVETAVASEPDAGAPAAPVHPHVWRIADDTSDSRAQILTGTVGKRGMLAAMLAAGLSDKEAHRVIRAFARVKNLDRANPKDAFAAERRNDDDAGSHLTAFELSTSPFDVWQGKEDDAGELVATKLELLPDHVRVAVALVVGDDLHAALKDAGLRDELLPMLDDALDGHAELSDIHAGARLRIVATEDRLDGEFVRYGALDAVEWLPEGRPSLRVYWYPKGWTDPQDKKERGHRGGYYDAKGRQPYHGGWRSPVPMARISSRFDPNRMHPVLHVVMPHNGVDFAAPPGTPVYAAASGVVRSAGDGGPCGNMVQIDHPNGLTTAYCHLSRFAAGLHGGEHVETRQLIGYVGQTGRATGPHLHFAVKRGEVFMDPLALKLDGVRVLGAKDREEFDDLRSKDDDALEAIQVPDVATDAGGPDAESPDFYDEPQ
jgi:murein DD-endopeptidase MepM/ murein hydrolase activator NlpD